jgi:peroxiredoxin
MRITLLFAITTTIATAQDLGDRGLSPTIHDLHSGYSYPARPVDTPATEVCLGDIAPDFSYQGVDARWRHLRDLVRDHPALLVFGANEGVLRILEGEREALMDLGVLPVAVTGSRLGTTRAMVQRYDLRYTLLADPQGVIASQFNAVDPASGRHLPAWFVLDSHRRVRALGRTDLPVRGYADRAAEALGLPPRGGTVPSSR